MTGPYSKHYGGCGHYGGEHAKPWPHQCPRCALRADVCTVTLGFLWLVLLVLCSKGCV